MGKEKDREKEKEREPAAREAGRPAREMFTDTRRVRELIKLMTDHELIELELVEDESKIKLKRSDPNRPSPTSQMTAPAYAAPTLPASSSSAAMPTPPVTEDLLTIRSPMVGTFYAGSNPETGPYITVGATVNEETVVCIIEAMKVFNEIRAEVSGVVSRILVQNGQAVEYNQPLFLLKP
jgi:acetyl-CoA carboxylase biotin carboxyl carrier protein